MNKKLLLIFFLLIFPVIGWSKDKLPVTVFYSPHCKICIKLKAEFLPKIKEKYKDKLDWKEMDIADDPQALKFFMAVGKSFNINSVAIPAILAGNVFLVGKNDILNKLEEVIDASLENKTAQMTFINTDLIDAFKKFSPLAITAAGLIDGVNPCAFAVIVFFISFLAVYGYKKKEIFWVGLAYCVAVFLTYLLLGLGLFKFLYVIVGFKILIKVFYYFIGVFCLCLSAMALYDYFRYKKTGQSDEMLLQLPKFLKKKINLVIGAQLREKNERGIGGLIASAFFVGVTVSLLEAACTGQVYLPTIVFILKNTNLRLHAWVYLILYNLMFILPLITIFVLSFFGFGSQKFNSFLKKHLAGLKILLCALFLLLGIMILLLS